MSAQLRTGDYLQAHFRDPKLRALLVSQWGDYGLPPAKSSFAIHATIAQHYFAGASYPVGGAGSIAAFPIKIDRTRRKNRPKAPSPSRLLLIGQPLAAGFCRPSRDNAKADQFKATLHFRTAESKCVDILEALKGARAGIK